MAVSAPYVFEWNSYFFSVSASLCFASVSLCNLRAYLQVEEAKDYSRYWALVYGVAAVLWFVSCWIPKPYEFLIWGIGVLFIIAAPLSKPSRNQSQRYPLDQEHLSERYGILTIIVLGESFVKVITDLSHNEISFTLIFQACFSLSLTCAIWWLYFDDVAGTKLKKGKISHIIWLYGHLPLQAAITATGVAVYKVGSLNLAEVIPLKYRWFICVCLSLVILSIAVIDFVSERRHQNLNDRIRINIRVGAGLFILLFVPIGSGITGIYFITGLISVFAALVIFDMLISPFEQESIEKLQTKSFEDLSKVEAKFLHRNADRKKAPINDAIIKGVPNELRHDIYSFYMEGGWTRVFVTAAVYFVVLNIIFAAVYMIDPTGIHNAESGSFLDAFFFSVQTLSTVGYGHFSPVGPYANAVVTVEVAIGLLSVAMVTGIIFAKASKAKSGIVFSDKALIVQRDGQPNLTFRLGNARGSEVVDATLNVSVVMDYVSAEGEHMRRLYDLNLVRSRTPLFRLTWTVFHVIDESSPIFGVDFTQGEKKIWAIIATVMGHEGTYGQTVYARNMYQTDDIITNARYVDVLSQTEDGRIVVDFDKFHSIISTSSV